MGYRILADENVERATARYLETLDHDVVSLEDVPELSLGAEDEQIAQIARESNRLILTQDDDFFTSLDVDDTAGVLFQTDQRLSAREVGDVIDQLSRFVEQADVRLEYVNEAWL